MKLFAIATLVSAPAFLSQAPVEQDPLDGEGGALVGSVSLPEESAVIMLRLRDGTIHWGAVSEHDQDGLRFSLLAHGGSVALEWALLDPSQETQLRERYGYIDVETEELMVDVETIILVDGKEYTGVILSREGDHFVLKHGGSLQMVPKIRVQNTMKAGRLPALDVYSREELYAMHAATTAEDDADDQLELAQLCEQILDFEHALVHYQAVLDLEPDTDHSAVELALGRAQLKAEQQAQIDYLREIDILRRQKKYDDALLAAEAFGDTFPDSPLQRDALEMRDRVLVARDEALRDLVRRRWNDHTRRIARTAAKKLEAYEAAQEYAGAQMGEEILAAVTADIHDKISEAIESDDIVAYWVDRKKVRFQNATYGQGTWLLGAERASAGTEDKSAKAAAPNERDAERQDLEKRIEKFLQNQARARQRRSSEDEADDQQAFWAEMSVDDRAQWIRAYYVEFSGDYELRGHPHLPNCPSCAGKGAREVISASATISTPSQGGGRGGGGQQQKPSGGIQLVTCSTCKGVGIQRRVYYR
ncbi:MAG: hypothetical protein O2816_03180 [Planctomycetota bacterium]|nr:hypothetical protein [Planctomycetota bacterium]